MIARTHWDAHRGKLKASAARQAACKTERAAAVERARSCKEHERTKRKEERAGYTSYLRSVGRGRSAERPNKPRGERRSESDADVLAEIPENLHWLWRREKQRYPLTTRRAGTSADHRAVKFMEDVAADWENIQAEMVARDDKAVSRMVREHEKQEREAYEQKRRAERKLMRELRSIKPSKTREAVPF